MAASPTRGEPSNLDAIRYPRASAWLASLPQGLASYPECRVRREAHEDLIRRLADVCAPEVPRAVAEVLWPPQRAAEWIPEVVGNALLLMGRDVLFSSDDRLFHWAKANMTRLGEKPLYKVLMRVVSPPLAVIGAARRWATFHTGTSLSTAPLTEAAGRHHAIVTLRHPARLYNPLLLEQLSMVYLAVVEMSRASEARVAARVAEETRSEFDLSWAAW